MFYLYENPNAQQKDMLKPLNMSRAILSQCCRMLADRRYIIQSGIYTEKKHNVAKMGIELINLIKDETN